MQRECFESGKMQIGCNYWASHAGIEMWRNWSEATVREDLQKLRAIGMSCLRVFPLWRDFQPLEILSGHQNNPFELSFRGRPEFPATEAGRAGIDEAMADRLQLLLDIAAENGLRVAVGLVTGWMSGRVFTPPAFANRNLITDAETIHWQVRMVRYLVKRFHRHPAIVAWGPGNECNCLSESTREQSWLWLATICSAIRSEDSEHPIASGMHSLLPGHPYRYADQPAWMLGDQNDLVDYFTTHPYPLFTPHAVRDGIMSYRNAFHAAAEGCFYADLGGKPCICEEFGTLAPLLGDDRAKRFYLRNVMNQLWAHDGRTLFWWCAFDQSHLSNAPYDWNAVERELGLFDATGRCKAFAVELQESLARLNALTSQPLPPRTREAVVVTTFAQDTWGNGWGAFLLAKQAGFDLRFANGAERLPEAQLYLVPGLRGDQALSRCRYLELLQKAAEGATVYLSLDDAFLSPLNQLFGFESLGLKERTQAACFDYAGSPLQLNGAKKILFGRLAPTTSVLAQEADGTPILLHTPYGRGELYLLTLPMERIAVETPDGFTQSDFYKLYRTIAAKVIAARIFRVASPLLSVTLHPGDARHVDCVIINPGPETVCSACEIAPGWQVDSIRDGRLADGAVSVDSGNAAFIKLICE